jgi:molecular chaperone GrpE
MTMPEEPIPNNAPPTDGGQAQTQDAPAPAADLQAQLDTANAKAAEYLDGWQRARADFANYKKRIERENAELSQNVAADTLARLLPVLDDFDLAMKNAPTEGEGAKWAEGVALVHRKFNTLLENNSIKRIEAEGLPFDPTVHEAVVHEESPDHEPGMITGILRQGYKLGQRVLRPALVKVAK